jgi:hypothetical protein
VDLEVRRGAVQASLQKAIEDIATPILTSNCQYKDDLTHAYFRGLHLSLLWPLSEKFRQSSLSIIMERITWFPESNPTMRKYNTCGVCQISYKPLLLDIRKKHLSSITGLCLDCVTDGDSNLKENNRDCRYAHSEAL